MQDMNSRKRLGDSKYEHPDDYRHIHPSDGLEVLAGANIEPAHEISAGAFDHVNAARFDTLCQATPFNKCDDDPDTVKPEDGIKYVHLAASSR